MNDEQFRAFLDLMMCSDPWPVQNKSGCVDVVGRRALYALLHEESHKRGYADWTKAHFCHMK